MIRRRDFLASAVGAWLTPLCSQIGWAAGTEKLDFSWLDARLNERVRVGHFNGISVQIGRGERLLHEAYFGDGAPNKVLHIASAGKWTAAATIAALVDEGHLSWSMPVKALLPQFADSKGEANLRQLLSHTAGYPDYQPPGRPRDAYQTLPEAVAEIAGLPPIAAPGTVFKYGGLAMQVAGRMAEQATGQTFEDIFQSRIAAPLRMENSGFVPVSQEDGFSPMLAGGFFADAADYGRFLSMISQNGLYRGRRVLSDATVREMQADQIGPAKVNAHEFVEEARADMRHDIYGLGEWREETDASGKPLLISSPGWAGAYPWIDKALGVWGVVIAKANIERAAADGYSTFFGSSIYAPMVRDAIEESKDATVRRHRVAVQGAQLYVEERGHGVPVIFLHGHGLDRSEWRAQCEVLQAHYHVIAYDMRGYGRSTNPTTEEAFYHAEDLRAVMDRLGIGHAHLVGRSLGCHVIMDFLRLHPRRAKSAAFIGSISADAPEANTQRIGNTEDRIAAIRKESVHAYKRNLLKAMMPSDASASDTVRKQVWRMLDQWSAWQLLHRGSSGLLPEFESVTSAPLTNAIPSLVLRDNDTPVSVVETPRTQVRLLVQAGPIPNLQQPAAVSSALLDFFGKTKKA